MGFWTDRRERKQRERTEAAYRSLSQWDKHDDPTRCGEVYRPPGAISCFSPCTLPPGHAGDHSFGGHYSFSTEAAEASRQRSPHDDILIRGN